MHLGGGASTGHRILLVARIADLYELHTHRSYEPWVHFCNGDHSRHDRRCHVCCLHGGSCSWSGYRNILIIPNTFDVAAHCRHIGIYFVSPKLRVHIQNVYLLHLVDYESRISFLFCLIWSGLANMPYSTDRRYLHTSTVCSTSMSCCWPSATLQRAPCTVTSTPMTTWDSITSP